MFSLKVHLFFVASGFQIHFLDCTWNKKKETGGGKYFHESPPKKRASVLVPPMTVHISLKSDRYPT